MEWCCAKCGLTATADDQALLLCMGWRVIAGGEMRCVLCVKREPDRVRGLQPVAPLDPPSDRRALR